MRGDYMVHLVYCDNKEKVLDKILSGKKTMLIRGAAGRKISHSRVFRKIFCNLKKKEVKRLLLNP